MTQEEIKEQRDLAYIQIAEAESKLKELREECKHPETFEGNYSYRVGAIGKAIICEDRGKMIKWLH